MIHKTHYYIYIKNNQLRYYRGETIEGGEFIGTCVVEPKYFQVKSKVGHVQKKLLDPLDSFVLDMKEQERQYYLLNK